MKSTFFWPWLVVLLSAPTFAAGTSSQPGMSALTFQYLPDSDYETVIGMGFYSFQRPSPGFYFSAQVTTAATSERDDYYQNLSPASFGHPVTGTISDFVTINAGMTQSVSEILGLYLGFGYASVTGYAELFDAQRILDYDGYYLVPESVLDDQGVNLNAGLLLFLGNLSLELGYHSFMQQGYVGIGFGFQGR